MQSIETTTNATTAPWKKEKLNHRKKCFCIEYLIDYNATRAARRAGYSEKFAARAGYRLLRKPEIQELLEEMEEKNRYETRLEARMVLDEAIQIMKNAEDDDIRLKAMALILKQLNAPGQNSNLPPLPKISV